MLNDHVELVLVPALKDNYVYLLHDRAACVTAVVDPGEAAPVMDALQERGWRLDYILATHHHGDHVAGIPALKEATGACVIACLHDAHRIPAVDRRVEEGERVTVGRLEAEVLFIPGHTLGHVAYHFAGEKLLFCGDTLFSLGCGRLFEGSPEQMFASLRKLRALPEETRVCCGHEYTEANARFALSIDPGNPYLAAREEDAHALRAEGKPTLPVTLSEEKRANPFLRCDDARIRARLGLEYATDAQVFARLRKMKDDFA